MYNNSQPWYYHFNTNTNGDTIMAKSTREEQLRRACRTIKLNIFSYNSLDDEGKIDQFGPLAAQISQTIWLVYPLPSGYISEKADAAVKAGLIKHNALTKEHYNPRLNSGQKILDLFSKIKYDENVLYTLLDEYTRVHLVLQSENLELKKRTSKNHPLCSTTWQEQYRGLPEEEPIVLIVDDYIPKRGRQAKTAIAKVAKVKSPKSVRTLHINNKKFASMKDVCDTYNITAGQAHYRFSSRSGYIYRNWRVNKTVENVNENVC